MSTINHLANNLFHFFSFWAWIIAAGSIFILSIIRAHPLIVHHEHSFVEMALVNARKILLTTICLLLLVLPVLIAGMFSATNRIALPQLGDAYVSMTLYWSRLIAASAIFGFLARFTYLRYAAPYISNMKRKFRVNLTSDQLSDIKDEKQRYTAKTFDPRTHCTPGHTFFGLDDESKPVQISVEDWYKKHLEIIGPTQYGKGVLIGTLIYQSIARGDSVIYVDPKSDTFIPHILAEYAAKFNRTFIYVDLNDDGPGGYHPFKGSTIRNARARLLRAFKIKDTEKESGYYRAFERNVADNIFGQTRKIKGLKQVLDNDEELSKKATKLHEGLKEWCQIESLNPKGDGVSIEKCLLNNAIVYVKGDLDDEVITKATKSMLEEIFQEAKRLHKQRTTHLTVYVDEMRFLTSEDLAKRLATTLGFDTNMVLSYQTITDAQNLEEGSNVNPKIVESGIHSNSQLKFVYGTIDTETAEWIAKLSGTQQKLVTQRETTEVGHLGEEKWSNQRSLNSIEESYITENTALSLPSRVGILFQPMKLAQTTYTSFIPVKMDTVFNKQNMSQHKHEETTA